MERKMGTSILSFYALLQIAETPLVGGGGGGGGAWRMLSKECVICTGQKLPPSQATLYYKMLRQTGGQTDRARDGERTPTF